MIDATSAVASFGALLLDLPFSLLLPPLELLQLAQVLLLVHLNLFFPLFSNLMRVFQHAQFFIYLFFRKVFLLQ
ncbi:MAG: hypothetical protein R2822_12525 [Spirosomataceae bacterium]